MKTIEELYKEVLASEELKKEFLTLKPDTVEDFLKAHGCDATLDELKAFFEAKKEANELAEEELSQVAGGKSADGDEAVMSIVGVGLGCAYYAILSLIGGDCGTAIKGSGMLCKLDDDKKVF